MEIYYKEIPNFLGAPISQGHAYFSSGCDFMMDLGKTQRCAKFEVARSIAVADIYIKEETPNFGEHT